MAKRDMSKIKCWRNKALIIALIRLIHAGVEAGAGALLTILAVELFNCLVVGLFLFKRLPDLAGQVFIKIRRKFSSLIASLMLLVGQLCSARLEGMLN